MIRTLGMAIGAALMVGVPGVVIYGIADGAHTRGKHLAGAAMVAYFGWRIFQWARTR